MHSSLQESILGEYYTISASGVVHMTEDGSPAEFIPIGQWVREHSVFNIMKQVSTQRAKAASQCEVSTACSTS